MLLQRRACVSCNGTKMKEEEEPAPISPFSLPLSNTPIFSLPNHRCHPPTISYFLSIPYQPLDTDSKAKIWKAGAQSNSPAQASTSAWTAPFTCTQHHPSFALPTSTLYPRPTQLAQDLHKRSEKALSSLQNDDEAESLVCDVAITSARGLRRHTRLARSSRWLHCYSSVGSFLVGARQRTQT